MGKVSINGQEIPEINLNGSRLKKITLNNDVLTFKKYKLAFATNNNGIVDKDNNVIVPFSITDQINLIININNYGLLIGSSKKGLINKLGENLIPLEETSWIQDIIQVSDWKIWVIGLNTVNGSSFAGIYEVDLENNTWTKLDYNVTLTGTNLTMLYFETEIDNLKLLVNGIDNSIGNGTIQNLEDKSQFLSITQSRITGTFKKNVGTYLASTYNDSIYNMSNNSRRTIGGNFYPRYIVKIFDYLENNTNDIVFIGTSGFYNTVTNESTLNTIETFSGSTVLPVSGTGWSVPSSKILWKLSDDEFIFGTIAAGVRKINIKNLSIENYNSINQVNCICQIEDEQND